MTKENISIFTIAPYRFLPANNGGHHAIINLHHYLGLLCKNTVVSTDDNSKEHNYSFELHQIFPDKPQRYLPGYGVNKMLSLAKKCKATHIVCEHPYMAISAMILADRLEIPFYIHSHNIESERFRTLGKAWWPILKKYEQYTMQKSDGVFFITPEDNVWAQEQYKLDANKCYDVPFGTNLHEPPKADGIKEKVAQELKLDASKPWLYFLGALDYAPNEDAVKHILNDILPRLEKKSIDAEVLIVGKGLDKKIQQQIAEETTVHYLGFVPDLTELLIGCDVMLNPVMRGGGIKTKAIEAVAYNNTVVSSEAGAAGLLKDACQDKLLVATDFDWDSFTELTIEAINQSSATPAGFYETYSSSKIAQHVLDVMTKD